MPIYKITVIKTDHNVKQFGSCLVRAADLQAAQARWQDHDKGIKGMEWSGPNLDPNIETDQYLVSIEEVDQSAPYAWIITEAFAIEELPPETKLIGLWGPSTANRALVEQRVNEATFELYDDDNNRCFAGKIYGSFSGFEPLDDWGKGGWGCTAIKINGEWL